MLVIEIATFPSHCSQIYDLNIEIRVHDTKPSTSRSHGLIILHEASPLLELEVRSPLHSTLGR